MKSGEPRNTKMNHSDGFRSHGLSAALPSATVMARKEAEEERQRAEIDVPDQARADQHELLAEREVRPRQQPLADPDGAQA
jgi:hypothetical protein